ncbi:MAG: molybdenum cofactor biosynthesis protein MoaE [Cardiobacteriaceae bacterium]|nr:molybdenum cofactor biosynthesis protein MoaE [Cardiobacteriaceae bacterium]
MSFIITDAPIDTARARQALLRRSAGGYASFEGWVRDHHAGKAVDKLIYSAYTEMAEKEGRRIIADAVARFDIEAAACIHRIGELAIGDMAVWVGVSAGHRGAAFDACRYIIDTIKGDVPIWKHEFYADGSRAWVLNHHCCYS